MKTTEPVLANPTTTTKRRAFWQRWFIDPIVAQLTQGITPEKIALTLAIGSGIAMFPIIGVTTILCFIAGIIWRLNQPILHLLNQALIPLHVVAIYFCVRWGESIFGEPHAQFGGIRAMARHMGFLFWNNQAGFWREFGVLVGHAIVVWAILVPFYVIAAYYIVRPFMRWIARWKTRTAAQQKPDFPL